MNTIFRLILTFNSTSLILIVYLIRKEVTINGINPHFNTLPPYVSYLLYVFLPLLTTIISLFLARLLQKDTIEPGRILEIEEANNSFLPSYLGYFFVATGIDNWTVMAFVYGILFVFTFLSQTLYYNPIFLVFGFHFYYIKTSNNTKIFLITKRILTSTIDLQFPELKRINNFTFIEL